MSSRWNIPTEGLLVGEAVKQRTLAHYYRGGGTFFQVWGGGGGAEETLVFSSICKS